MIDTKNTDVSFEFFPPKSDAGIKKLQDTIKRLDTLNPKYASVTFGAGGSSREGTANTLKAIASVSKTPLASHLTYICMTRDEIMQYIDNLWNNGIRHIVALRGDMPDDADVNWPLDKDDNYYQYTSDFVEGIKSYKNFEISVGAYPEKHPDAPSMDADIAALKLKCDAGADRAITQFFFDNNVYYDFVDACEKARIKTPIVPGILPIFDFEKVQGFAEKCHASIPDSITGRFEKFKNNPQDTQKLMEEILTLQISDLVKNGVKHLHFYTLNRSETVIRACRNANITG